MENDLITLTALSRRLGVDRATASRRVARLGLPTYANPVDRREILVSLSDYDEHSASTPIAEGRAKAVATRWAGPSTVPSFDQRNTLGLFERVGGLASPDFRNEAAFHQAPLQNHEPTITSTDLGLSEESEDVGAAWAFLADD